MKIKYLIYIVFYISCFGVEFYNNFENLKILYQLPNKNDLSIEIFIVEDYFKNSRKHNSKANNYSFFGRIESNNKKSEFRGNEVLFENNIKYETKKKYYFTEVWYYDKTNKIIDLNSKLTDIKHSLLKLYFKSIMISLFLLTLPIILIRKYYEKNII